MNDCFQYDVSCNGASPPGAEDVSWKQFELNRSGTDERNVTIRLPNFVERVFHLPERILDLLEIAAYVYCADRFASRGKKDAVEYHKWSRRFRFRVKVRDFDFWRQPHIAKMLDATLTFLSGDQEFSFLFEPGHATSPTDLFDRAGVTMPTSGNTKIILFSGGLDSLAGVIESLEGSSDKLYLVSHRSNQPQTVRTQDRLVKALAAAFPNRVQHYKFYCHLSTHRAAEETQRTRMFLYSSIALALCSVLSQKEILIFENGITSLNFGRRQDLMNGRATRTTHPKTIHLLERLFSEVAGEVRTIRTPFFDKTKSDVVRQLQHSTQGHLIPSSVSCSKTFRELGSASHCGGCSQCVDRRLAIYAAGLATIDEPESYAIDFIKQTILDGEVRTTLLDYIRQAGQFAEWNLDHFYHELIDELAEVVDFIHAADDDEACEAIWKLCRRHGTQVLDALHFIREKHDKLVNKVPPKSLERIS